MKLRVPAAWRADFIAGLAVLLPVVVSVALLVWLFGTVSNVTDSILFFLPRSVTHQDGGVGRVHWYWSLVALVLTVVLIGFTGHLARYYVGKQAIQLVDRLILSVPLLNKIYGTVKQVNAAFASNSKSAFRQVVLVEFPQPGQFSVGFVTSEQNPEIQARVREPLVSVFIPTTPNPTTGFLVLVPAASLTKLDMSVADGIKFIISLGSVSPDYGGLPGSGRTGEGPR